MLNPSCSLPMKPWCRVPNTCAHTRTCLFIPPVPQIVSRQGLQQTQRLHRRRPCLRQVKSDLFRLCARVYNADTGERKSSARMPRKECAIIDSPSVLSLKRLCREIGGIVRLYGLDEQKLPRGEQPRAILRLPMCKCAESH